jgi:hypothetical protein
MSGTVFALNTASAGTMYYCAVVSDSGVPGYSSASNAVEVTVDPSLSAGTASATVDPVNVGEATMISTTGAAGGSGVFTYAWSGLPPGCGSTAASFACTPTSNSDSPYIVLLTVTDTNGAQATTTFVLTVDPKLITAYSVTFLENGLPSTLNWQVIVDGLPMSLTTDGATDNLTYTGLTNGTHSYSITDLSGWHQATLAYNGSVMVGGASVREPTLRYTPVTYSVEFTESGLRSGLSWSVTLIGNLESTAGMSISFTEPNGTYGYAVGSVSGYTSSPSSGTTPVNGANVTQVITFAPVTIRAIAVSPSRGPAGATVTVSGTGFSVSTKLKSLVFDSKTITSCTSGSLTTGGTGAFSCTFKVPSATSGTTVKATDVGGKTATGKFTVTSAALPGRFVQTADLTIPQTESVNRTSSYKIGTTTGWVLVGQIGRAHV